MSTGEIFLKGIFSSWRHEVPPCPPVISKTLSCSADVEGGVPPILTDHAAIANRMRTGFCRVKRLGHFIPSISRKARRLRKGFQQAQVQVLGSHYYGVGCGGG